MILKRNIFFLFLLFLQAICFCQNVDSLNTNLKREKDDSLALAAQLELIELKKESNDKKGLSFVYHSVAQVYYDKQAYETSVEYFMLSLIICRENHDDIGMANCYQSLADAHKKLSHYAEGIRYYSDAIDVYTDLGDKTDMADCYLGISSIYEIKKNISQAISHTRNAQNLYTYTRNKEKIEMCIARIKKLKSER
ncbi:MAG: tetratricopeptide repeat protein [Bacteroidia bacterium]